MDDVVKTKKEPPYRFKKGDRVCSVNKARTWGYAACGVSIGPYCFFEEKYVVAQDSEPVDPHEPDKYHWWLRLEGFPGVKFLAADFKKCNN